MVELNGLVGPFAATHIGVMPQVLPSMVDPLHPGTDVALHVSDLSGRVGVDGDRLDVDHAHAVPSDVPKL
jgi:hypothetical protein